eukprot:9127877-Pyramimonas_sp.AAC.1
MSLVPVEALGERSVVAMCDPPNESELELGKVSESRSTTMIYIFSGRTSGVTRARLLSAHASLKQENQQLHEDFETWLLTAPQPM